MRARQEQQLATFIDSTGRTFSLQAHTLPSARSQGEPLSGRVNPIAGATFEGVMMGNDEDLYLMASNGGYGFVTTLGELHARNKAGKAVLNLSDGARVMAPQRVNDVRKERVALVTNDGTPMSSRP